MKPVSGISFEEVEAMKGGERKGCGGSSFPLSEHVEGGTKEAGQG